MAKFNEKVVSVSKTLSYEGGLVYEKSPVEEWLNFLFSSYLEDTFYENASYQTERFIDLTTDMLITYGAEFVAKAAMFARNELGMRSVSQLTAAILNNYHFDNKRSFFRNFPHRPDDIAEIFGAIDMLGEKRSHALIRGSGDYLSALSSYTIGKYKMSNHTYNMYDLINITHANSLAIDSYKRGNLTAPDTWEVAISTAEDKEERQKEWKRLVEANSLGYLALIRNLRNILKIKEIDNKWIATYLVPQLVNSKAIHQSLVFPYQIYSAYKNMEIKNTLVIAALEKAFHISLDNMPQLTGDTLIILDVSGSMTNHISRNSNITIREIGAVYAVCIALTSKNSEIIKFATTAQHYNFNKLDNVFEQIAALDYASRCGYGTNVGSAYQLIDRKYDRIMLISDMQIMVDAWYDGISSYERYCNKYGNTPIYSFDLGNYHTQLDNPRNPNVHLCTSLSEKTLKLISLLEDGQNLVSYINDNYDYR